MGATAGYGDAVTDAARIERLAREKLGIEELHPGQLEAIEAVLSGRDTLAVMSTGYGKSAIYQLAGELLDGPTIVVSPLIALQRDQVEAIEEHTGAGEAAELNSTVSPKHRHELIEELEHGEREFVLLAPEQLAKPEVLAGAGRDRTVTAGRRRGPLHQRVGSRLPPRLPAARRLRGAPRPSHDPRPHRDRLAPGPSRDRRAPRHGAPGAGDPRLRPSQPALRGSALLRGEGERGNSGGGSRGGAQAGHRLHRHPQDERGARGCVAERRRERRGLPCRTRLEASRRAPGPLPRRRGRRDRGDHRLRHGHRQAERPLRLPRRPVGLDRLLLPGGGTRGPRRRTRRRGPLLPARGRSDPPLPWRRGRDRR